MSRRPRSGQRSSRRRLPHRGALTFAPLLLIVGAVIWWTWRPARFAIETAADRNVLFVTIDTLRADVLRLYGGTVATPNLERLAARGATFNFAHAHSVVTLPSHASILTGRYPYEHGLRDNVGYRLDAAQTTLATRLEALGFATGAFVGGFPLDQRFGLAHGFDTYDDRVGELAARGQLLPERPADAVVDSALEWIDGRDSKWFAWVHVFDPHSPYAPPEAWRARYPGNDYFGEVAWTDFALGYLFTRLAEQPRPTLVIVTADHGESLGDHDELSHGLFAYEPTLRVPLLISQVAPGTSEGPRGVRIDSPARHVDLVPTVLEALGEPSDETLSGLSLTAVVNGRDSADRPSYFEAMTATLTRGWAPLRGVLVGREKYIDLPIPELYDLSTDPAERDNVHDDRAARVDVLRRTLDTFDTAPPGRPGQETGEVLERLRALGYASTTGPSRAQFTVADDPKRLADLERLIQRATAAWESGRPDDAIELYRQVIARRPDTEDAYRYLAFVQWEIGRPDDAIATLEQALAAGLTGEEVRIKLGQYLARSGDARRAISLLEGTSGNPDALIALGIAYASAGRTADALEAFEAAIAQDPTSGLGYENIGTLQLQAGDLAAAEASLKQALAIDPNLPAAHTALGVVLIRTQRADAAVESWKRAVALDPTEFDALFNLTVQLVRMGRVDEARPFGQQFMATAPPALYGSDIAVIRQRFGGGSV